MDVAIYDPVHIVETVHKLCEMLASFGNLVILERCKLASLIFQIYMAVTTGHQDNMSV